MGKLEFGPDGKLKLPEKELERIEKEKESVILTKIQVSEKLPAIAQLKVELGVNLKEKFEGTLFSEEDKRRMIKEIRDFCEDWTRDNCTSVESRIWVNSENAVITEARESKFMYTVLTTLAEWIKPTCEQKCFVVMRGSYTRFDN